MATLAGLRGSLQQRIMLSVALGLLALVTVLGLGMTQILKASTRRELDERLRAATHIAEHLNGALAEDVERLRRVAGAAGNATPNRPDPLASLADQFNLFTWATVAEGGQLAWTNAPPALSDALRRRIGQTLHVSVNTVRNHIRQILEKLNLRNRVEAAAYAAREGLISSSGLPESSREDPAS